MNATEIKKKKGGLQRRKLKKRRADEKKNMSHPFLHPQNAAPA
jgi:hypothetical protein